MESHRDARNNIIDRCTACGACVKVCPSIVIAELQDTDPHLIQKRMKDFLKKPGIDDDCVSRRIDSCWECYRCVGTCPMELNPLEFIYLAKDAARRAGHQNYRGNEADPWASHVEALEKDLDENQRRRITTPSFRSGTVFFPGCNIYRQPRLLIRLLDILQQIDDSISLLPGMTNCCGSRHALEGNLPMADKAFAELTDELVERGAETLILWCPTCLTYLSVFQSLPARAVSVFQFLSEHINRIPFDKSCSPVSVTLHEPCKTAFTGLDTSHRKVLRTITGIQLKEMVSEARCCGSGGMTHYAERTTAMGSRRRYAEARASGASILLTVCHYCHEVFQDLGTSGSIPVENIVNLIHDRMMPETPPT